MPPILHLETQVDWHDTMPIPPSEGRVQLRLEERILSVRTKAMGAFVQSETQYYHHASSASICTIRTTTLILGVEGIPNYKAPDDHPKLSTRYWKHSFSLDDVWFEQDYQIPYNQALLYRLTSGDSNVIHVVDPATVPLLQILLPESDEGGRGDQTDERKGALLHGLCTLGLAFRTLVHRYLKHENTLCGAVDLATLLRRIRHLSAKMKSPVFVGDRISIQAGRPTTASGDGSIGISFRVVRKASLPEDDAIAIDNGLLVVKAAESSRARPKL